MADNKNIGNVIGGHKAALNNPNVSEEAKQRSRAAVEDLQESGEYEPQESFKNAGNVAGGHKATLNNPRVSEDAKEHSRQILEDKDAL